MKLGDSQCPILQWLRPFFPDAFYGAENEFEQGIFGSEGSFGFSIFPDLAVETFDSIRGINQLADFGGILEIARQMLPIIMP